MIKSKIRCPKCRTVYSIDSSQINIIGKKAARCIICDSRFFIENREDLKTSDNAQSGVSFLQSYFEKRCGIVRRKLYDRRTDIKCDDLSLSEFSNDIIPIFNSEGDAIIGHISPGRRQGLERRSGLERRQYLMEESKSRAEMLSEYKLDVFRVDAS